MTATTPGHGAGPSLEIEFQEGMPPEQRQSVEQSIATLVERATETTAQALAASTERAELTAALNRPLLELIRSDPAAAKALEAAQARLQPVDDLRGSQPRAARIAKGQELITLDMRGAPEVFVIPYHFNWRWHVPPGGAPQTSTADLPSGQITLDARAARPPDGIDVRFIDAHAGFGISVTTDRDVDATARAMRRVRYIYSVSAGFQGDATAEGGEELTVMEAGNLLDSDRTVVFRKRVSGTPVESAYEDSGGYAVGEPMEVTWRMLANHTYQFNVGQWVFCERNPGLGGAGAISQIQGTVLLMTLFR